MTTEAKTIADTKATLVVPERELNPDRPTEEVLRVNVAALLGREVDLSHLDGTPPPPDIVKDMAGRNLALMALPPDDGTRYIGWAAYHDDDGSQGYVRFVVQAKGPGVKRTRKTTLSAPEPGFLGPDWTLIVGESLPSFVSDTVGRTLRAGEFTKRSDLIRINYRDPAKHNASAARLRAERATDDRWVVRLRWRSGRRAQELRFVALGPLRIDAPSIPEAK